MIKGQCLCGTVKFILHYDKLKCYSCHCGLCRKATGTFSNVATMVDADLFEFTSGTNHIRAFTRVTGFQVNFCETCGSSLPKKLRNTDKYWVPIGLLENDETIDITLVAHIHLASKAHGDTQILPSECATFSDSPGIDKVAQLLNN